MTTIKMSYQDFKYQYAMSQLEHTRRATAFNLAIVGDKKIQIFKLLKEVEDDILIKALKEDPIGLMRDLLVDDIDEPETWADLVQVLKDRMWDEERFEAPHILLEELISHCGAESGVIRRAIWADKVEMARQLFIKLYPIDF